jgi:hypothetical protein
MSNFMAMIKSLENFIFTKQVLQEEGKYIRGFQCIDIRGFQYNIDQLTYTFSYLRSKMYTIYGKSIGNLLKISVRKQDSIISGEWYLEKVSRVVLN